MSTTALQTKESALVQAAQQLAAQVPEVAEIRAALAAADTGRGIVIATDEDHATVQALYKTVSDGEKAVREAEARVLRIPKAMEQAVRNITSPLRAKLATAKKALGDAHVAYVSQREREAQAELKRRQDEAAKAAKAQREVEQDPHAPPVDVYKPYVPTVVQGATGSLHTVRDMKVEAVDLHAIVEFDPSLLKLDEMRARDLARDWERAAEGAPHARGGFVVAGIRFWRELRAAGR